MDLDWTCLYAITASCVLKDGAERPYDSYISRDSVATETIPHTHCTKLNRIGSAMANVRRDRQRVSGLSDYSIENNICFVGRALNAGLYVPSTCLNYFALL